jgi:hypothetical protein
MSRGFTLRTALLVTALTMFFALGAGQALANHVACGDTITQDTTLDSDLIDCPDSGLVIGAPNVTLDLNGHTIDGLEDLSRGEVPPYGVGGAYPGTVIENGTVRSFFEGIFIHQGADSSVVKNVSLPSTHDLGLLIADSANVTVIGSNLSRGMLALRSPRIRITANSGFVSIDHSDDALIDNNHLSNYYDALTVRDSRRARVEYNITEGNLGVVGEDNLVKRNSVNNFPSGCGAIGVVGLNNRVEQNAVQNASPSGCVGIALGGSMNGRIRQNRVEGGVFGIWVVPPGGRVNASADNLIFSNDVTDAGTDGIRIEPGDERNDFERNVVTRSGDDGIQVADPTTILSRNRAYANGDLGIEAVEGTIDGGHNRAFGNGNPLQCLNIECKQR